MGRRHHLCPDREGWLYLVSVMDLCNRQVVGWAMGEHHDAALATSALDMAILRRRPDEGLILHSDRGAPLHLPGTRIEGEVSAEHERDGRGYDNASAESFFATLKLEAVPGLATAVKAPPPPPPPPFPPPDCLVPLATPLESLLLYLTGAPGDPCAGPNL